MAKQIEKGIIDKLFNRKMLGKRKLGKATKYYYDGVINSNSNRFVDILYFPRNKLDKIIGNIYERCMPGFQYFIWDEHVRWARYHGYTLAEKLHHSWRAVPNIMLHSMAQTLHPWGYLESQRRDQFIRRVTTLLPGIECPDWAQENKRVHDYDLNSISAPYQAFKEVCRESTPAPHILPPNYTAIHHIFNQRFNFGYVSQRLFYNEELRGDYYSRGLLSESDKSQIFGWYADSQGQSQRDRINSMPAVEKQEFLQNKKRWDTNFVKFYPEVNQVTYNPITHKYDEPYFERNINDIRGSIFTQKWLDALGKSVFDQEEIEMIHQFFLNENTEVFFKRNSIEDEYESTELYSKFVKELDFPNFFEIDRFTTYPPEKQFYDLMDKNWGINFETVDAFRRKYIEMIKGNSQSTKVNLLVLEEVYNPIFRRLLQQKYNYNVKQNESISLQALQNGASLEEIIEFATITKENAYLCSLTIVDRMVYSQVRKVVSSFHFTN